jgi:protein phosphatase
MSDPVQVSTDAGERTVAVGEPSVCALSGASRRGSGRDANQDRWAALSHAGGALLVVADGMGGTKGGAVAAAVAVAAVLGTLVRAAPDPLTSAVSVADRAVRKVGEGTGPAWSRAGCTLTAAVLTDGWADIAHVGDSSCWLARAGALRRLTEVHTTAARLAAAGATRAAGCGAARLDHLLTRYLGMPGGAEVQRHRLRLRPGDRVLVATDGLTRSLGPVELRTLLADDAPPQDLVAAAVTAAVAAGARDDITAVLATVGRP